MSSEPAPHTESPPPPNRFGRSGVLVFVVALATAGAFGVAGILTRDHAASNDVLFPLMLIIGGVGIAWSLVLAVRAVANRESLLFPYLIALPVFWALSVPLLQTWPEFNRGGEDRWYFLHAGLFPLLIPLGVFALTIAGPPLFWLVWKRNRAEESERPRLRRRARWIFFGVATAVFILLLPFGFYLYGGTMNRYEIWTLDAVRYMPNWIGDVDYFVLRQVSGKASERLATRMLDEGLLSPDTMIVEIANKGWVDVDRSFSALLQKSRTHALKSARDAMMSPSGPPDERIARYFGECGSVEDVENVMRTNGFSKLNPVAQKGFLDGVTTREDKFRFVAAADALVKESETAPATQVSDPVFAAMYIVCSGNDDVVVRTMFMKILDVGGQNVMRVASLLRANNRSDILKLGFMRPEAPTRHAVLVGVLRQDLLEFGRFSTAEELRVTYKQLLESSDEMDRVITALIVLAGERKIHEGEMLHYSLTPRGKNSNLSALQLGRSISPAEKQNLVERALELMSK